MEVGHLHSLYRYIWFLFNNGLVFQNRIDILNPLLWMSITRSHKCIAVLCLQSDRILAVDLAMPGGIGLCCLVGKWSMQAIAVSVLLHVDSTETQWAPWNITFMGENIIDLHISMRKTLNKSTQWNILYPHYVTKFWGFKINQEAKSICLWT